LADPPVNFGGPGPATSGERNSALYVFGSNLDTHDLLLTDDRGRGFSGTIDCEELQHGIGPLHQEIADCAAQLGNAASRYGTGDIAQDNDAVRAALGYDKVDYHGGSYGGADVTAYATRFGEHLRSLVLDAPYGTPGLNQFMFERDRTSAEPRMITLDCSRSPNCSPDHPFPLLELDGLIWTVRLSPVEGDAYDANGNAQIDFFDAREPYVLLHGNRGCGKSAALLWKALQTCYLVPGCRVAILRKTLPELKKSLWDELLKLPRDLYQDLNATDHVVSVSAQDRDGTWKPSKIWFVSAQNVEDASKLLSGEYHLVLFDEWSQFEHTVWKFITGSVRSPIARDRANRPTSAQVAGATTPGGIGAEALRCLFGCDGPKKQVPGEPQNTFKPEQYRAIRASIDQNPTYALGTSAGDGYRRMLSSLPAAQQAKWLYGLWTGFEGQYFDCLDESCTLIDHDVFLRLRHQQQWEKPWISIDWGRTHHSSVTWHQWLQIDGFKFVVTYASYLVRGIGETALAQELVDMTRAIGDEGRVECIYLSPETFGDNPFSRAQRMGDVFVANGLPRPLSANNDREDGLTLMYELLNQRHEGVNLGNRVRTLSGWLITNHRTYPIPEGGENPTPIECLSQAIYDPKSDGDIVKQGDAVHLDVNDSLRYGIASHLLSAGPTEKPLEVRRAEALRPFVELMHDQSLPEAERRAIATSMWIRGEQMADECEPGGRPLPLGRYRRR
jgi:pimeloyl-ACP methyl ester carboxylesterase